MKRYLINTGNPQAFDKTINSLGAAALEQDSNGEYIKEEGYYIMRILANPGYITFAIKNQGYGEIIKEID